MKYERAKLTIEGGKGPVTIHGWAEVDNHWNEGSVHNGNTNNQK